MTNKVTFQDVMEAPRGPTTGFDYLRLGLAIAVLLWHSSWNTTGVLHWNTPLRFLPAAIVPAFFALSGFLVAGSLERNTLRGFLTLRLVRILPALAVEITLSAFIIGLLFTTLTPLDYLTNRHFFTYFLNIIGIIHYTLPGVFAHNIGHNTINGQLWTIPFEFECYFVLALLSILKIIRHRFLFTMFVAILAVFCMGFVLRHGGGNRHMHVPGRALVLSFLAAVSIYQYRNVLPYSNVLAAVAALCASLCLEFPAANYLAAFPVAYLTIWLGLKRPPAIPFGDLSYGIYLFHYPIQQTIMHLFPQITAWWVLSLVSLPFTMGFALLSWTLIEHPVLRRKKPILAAVDRAFARLKPAQPGAGWGPALGAPALVPVTAEEPDAG